jgi:hypothetical protein
MNGGLNKWLVCMLVAGTAASLTACGSEDGGGDTSDQDAGTDGGNTTDGGDTDAGGTDTDTSNPDTDPGVCETASCERNRDCAELGDNFTCVAGCCEEQAVEVQCARPGEPCDSETASNDEYFCDTGLGQCLTRCADALTDSTEGGNCPPRSNTFCLATNDPEPPQDPNTGDILDGICVPGDCTSQFNEDGTPNPAACEGVTPLGETTACGADDCTCIAVANGANFCTTAGPGDAGDECGREEDGSDGCAGGLTCFRGICLQACDLANEDTACTTDAETVLCVEGADCSCIEALDTSGDNEPGVCAAACGPFSAGECADGSTCTPSFGRFGLNDWLCTPVADAPVPIGGACDVNLGNFGQCAEGGLCTSEVEGGPGICTPLCDPRNPASGDLAACTSSAAGAELIGDTAFGEASDYLALEAGAVTAELRIADGAALSTVTYTAAAGTASSAIATFDDAGDLDIFVIDDLAEGDNVPDSGIRGFHAAAGVGDVDVYLGIAAEGVTYGTIAGPLLAAEGDNYLTVITGAGSLGPIELAGLTDTGVYTAVAINDGSSAAVELVAPATFTTTAGSGYVRAFHGANGAPNVDIYVDGTQVYTDLAYGDTSSLEAYAALPADTYTIEIFAAGDDPDTDTALLTTDVTVVAGQFSTFMAYFASGNLTVEGFSFGNAPTAGSASIVAIHASSNAGEVDLVIEGGTPIREDLGYGEALSSDDSAYVGLPAGSYNVSIRGAGAAPDSAAAISSGIFSLGASDLLTLIAAGSAADGLEAIAVVDELPALTTGGALRIVHAAAGGPVVTLNAPGVAEDACAPISIDGLGFCQELCEPFPRRPEGEYPGCDNPEDSCIPYTQRDDRPVLPVGQCGLDEGTIPAGGVCPETGVLGGGCVDFAVCLAAEVDAVEGECLPLCENFVEDSGCADGTTCSGVPPLLGTLAFSFCVNDAQPGNVGDRCTEPGTPCAGDGTLCITVDQAGTNECVAVCRQGFGEDCGTGTTCRTGVFGSQVPSFMGICL